VGASFCQFPVFNLSLVYANIQEKVTEGHPMSNEKGTNDPGNSRLEWFLYEIMQSCLVITLTSLHQLRKMRDIQKQKEKRLTRSLP
jgi:hypothetical protein